MRGGGGGGGGGGGEGPMKSKPQQSKISIIKIGVRDIMFLFVILLVVSTEHRFCKNQSNL